MSALAVVEDGPGDAPPLLLLPAVGADTSVWAPVVGPLAERFRVLRLDWPGHGGSPARPGGGPLGVDDLVADVVATLDGLGVGRVPVAGLSLGGMVAVRLAARRPERVGRLALLCTSAYPRPAEVWRERAAAVRADGLPAVADTVVARWVTPELAASDPALVADQRRRLAAVDAASYAALADTLAALDLRPDLPRVASSTLVVAAADDVALPPEHQHALAEHITGARLETVPGGHLATLEQPGRVAALLLDHLHAGDVLAAGSATRRAVLGDAHVDRAQAATTPLTAPFQDLITRYAWGDVWTRPDLTRRERSIATLAALTAIGAEHELALHVRAARRNGLTGEQIVGVLLHTAVYGGVPRANRAIAVAQSVLHDLDEEETS